MTELMSHLQLR